MGIKYEYAPDLQVQAEEICQLLFPHVKIGNVSCVRSFGSSSRGTIARCHALGKVMQMAMRTKAFYAVEFISEQFEKLPDDEKIKVIIHELMHIPKAFGGGFVHHDFVTDKNVNILFNKYLKLKERDEKEKLFMGELKNENKSWW